MSASPTTKKTSFPGSIEFELTDLENARLALEELPEGVDKVPTLAANYWEQRRRKPLPTDRALQGATIDWMLKLPVSLRPRELCDRFPSSRSQVRAGGAALCGGQSGDNRARRHLKAATTARALASAWAVIGKT
jgi:hypothetical protein